MLKLFDRYWMAIVMLLSIAALPMRLHASTPTIVFSEIAWAGSSLSSSDEWIELTNVSDQTIDLSNWTITGAGSSEKILTLPENSLVEAHSTYLIANYENTNENAASSTTANFVTSTVSLSNSGFSLYLYDHTGALVDLAGDGSTPFAGRSGSTSDTDDGRYVSMVRMDGITDGSLAESWTSAQTSEGFKEGIEDYGSPGIILFASSQNVDLAEETTETEETTIPEETMTEENLTQESLETNGENTQEDLNENEVASEEEFSQETISEEPVAESVSVDTESAETNDSVETQTVSLMLFINEFVVDPNEGETEWIELVNASDQTIDLTGWSVEDSSGKQTFLEGSLGSSEYLLIDSPVGKLNNDTDTIVLKNSTGTVMDSVTYGTEELIAPKDGTSLARNTSGTFELTYTPTPNTNNTFTSEAPEPVQEPVEQTTEDTSTTTESETTSSFEEEQVNETTEELTQSTEMSETQESTGSSVSQTPSTTQTVLPVGTLLINEFVVDPLEEELEWIELINTSENSVTLTGWTLEDASGKTTDLSSMTIEGSSYALVVSPKGKLNNDGDTIILKDENGTVVDAVVYGTDAYPVPKDGMSLARNAETFELTQQTTPAAANLIFIALEDEDIQQETTDDQEDSIEETTSESSQASEESSSITTPIKTIRFFKLYPNTSGTDETEEYIELFNTGTEAADLTGWSIEDGSTDRYTIEYSLILNPQTSLRLLRPQTNIALNNTGDTVELIAPDAEIVDKVTYGNASKGAVYELSNGIWSWSQTNGTQPPNSSTQPTSKTTTISTSSVSSASVRINQLITMSEAQEKKDGESVTVRGVIIAVPGTFGTQVCYIMDETGGIQVYLHDGFYPALVLGDVIQI